MLNAFKKQYAIERKGKQLLNIKKKKLKNIIPYIQIIYKIDGITTVAIEFLSLVLKQCFDYILNGIYAKS